MKAPKQTIVFRKDLQCRKGKFASQIAHASMKVFFDRMVKKENGYDCSFTPEMEEWKNGIFTKIVVGCEGEDEIRELERKANELGVPNAVIVDSGATEFHSIPTVTCIALGPYKAEVLEELTQKYSLL